jgi:DNA-directed RNA polymerase subunit RPC12/RpoP
MKQSYHCLSCNKDFIDRDMAKEHRQSTSHEIVERTLEK